MTTELQIMNRKGRRQVINKHDLQTYENQTMIIENIIKIYKKCTNDKLAQEKCAKHANFLLQILLQQNNRITTQEILDFQLELNRFEKFVQMCSIESDGNYQLIKTKENVMAYQKNIWKILNSIEKYSEKDNMVLEKLIKDFRNMINKNMTITAEEKQMIVKALGMQQGHWFKCPNGHTYCITECGGAMQVGKCNECGAPIGGTNHSLLDTNRHDGSMDGSRAPAWSNTANNMANFDLRNIV